MSEVILNSSGECYNMIITLGPLIVLWSGLMNIAEKSNLLYKLGEKTLKTDMTLRHTLQSLQEFREKTLKNTE